MEMLRSKQRSKKDNANRTLAVALGNSACRGVACARTRVHIRGSVVQSYGRTDRQGAQAGTGRIDLKSKWLTDWGRLPGNSSSAGNCVQEITCQCWVARKARSERETLKDGMAERGNVGPRLLSSSSSSSSSLEPFPTISSPCMRTCRPRTSQCDSSRIRARLLCWTPVESSKDRCLAFYASFQDFFRSSLT